MSGADIEAILQDLRPITLLEMDKARLQKRTDTKYVFAERHLPMLIQALAADHHVLRIDGRNTNHYRTLYFDSPDLRSYLDHHNGRSFRTKVRIREYVGSGLFFLEVKRRTGRGGTKKARIAAEGFTRQLNTRQLEFVAGHSTLGPVLHPTLCNEFTRFTLVHHSQRERITLDTGLTFHTAGRPIGMDGICVAEVKQAQVAHRSTFALLMRQLQARPLSFSKYCIGMVLSHPELKYNRFKPSLLQATKAGATVGTLERTRP